MLQEHSHSQLTLLATQGATNRHHDCLATNSCDSESLPEESRGSLTSQSSRNSNKSGNKTNLQNSKSGNTFCRVLQSNGNIVNASTTTRVRPKTTPAEPVDNTMRKQPSAHTHREKLTEPRSNHVRPESHDTSTNIPDLLEVGKEQPGVTTRDTKHPSENDISPLGTTTSTSTRSRAYKQNHPGPWTHQEVSELHTPVPPRTTPRNGLLKQQMGACTRHPERTHRT
ncbi:hypothetical protein Taro_019426 [Colocasia esculenta]|uniref:Uncharacterized protein n=1 Tax=Colocasia esculenta TaxID=4460 RepID=A0A843UTV9_COLES|nr:hypothetical protein [Colocasia esculenta]